MKFQLEQLEGRNRFTAHGPGYVEVNGQRIEGCVIVGGDFIDREGMETPPDRFAAVAIDRVLALSPELVLLGTGSRLLHPDRRLLAPLHQARIGVEVMDTPAACRTFNILLAEGRKVVAALRVD